MPRRDIVDDLIAIIDGRPPPKSEVETRRLDVAIRQVFGGASRYVRKATLASLTKLPKRR